MVMVEGRADKVGLELLMGNKKRREFSFYVNFVFSLPFPYYLDGELR